MKLVIRATAKRMSCLKGAWLLIVVAQPLIGLAQDFRLTSSRFAGSQSTAEPPVEKLESLGARVFIQGGRVVEVNLDRTKVADADLRLVSGFPEITDLSLEETHVGDAGMIH